MARNAVRYRFATFAFAALTLRIAVPAGLMPASEDGWFLSLCPDGQPAHVISALLGQAHHHDDAATTDEPSGFAQCELGAGLALMAVAEVSPALPEALPAAPPNATEPAAAPASNRRHNYESRAPPTRALHI